LCFALLAAALPRLALADDCFEKRGDEQIAACNAQLQAKQTPSDQAISLNNRGNAYAAKGDLDRAIADYNQAISLDPKYPKAYHGRAILYKNRGDLDRAVADYSQAIALDPKYSIAYNNRGVAYEGRGDLDRAIADYSQAISLDRKYVGAYSNRGNIYKARGDFDRAIADYNQAISLDPKFAVAYNNRGAAYAAKGDLDRAIADYGQAIGLDPKYVFAYGNRGNMFRDKGEFDRAIADYDQAISLDPKNIKSYFNRGVANLYAGSLPKALADLNQYSASDPHDPYGALWLEVVNQRSDLPSRLEGMVTPIDMTRWPAPVIRLFLGQSTPDAVLAAADHPGSYMKAVQVCEANFFSGELALSKGSKDDAARLFRLAAESCPPDLTEWSTAHFELKAMEAGK
jgi:tetratricopeptide (TPR) repeat protein